MLDRELPSKSLEKASYQSCDFQTKVSGLDSTWVQFLSPDHGLVTQCLGLSLGLETECQGLGLEAKVSGWEQDQDLI